MNILETQGISKHYGALLAVDGVDLEFKEKEVHAIIGPNGAGKTTLINLLSRDVPATLGKIFFKGQDITNLAPHLVLHLGIGRSYQKTNIFAEFTCLKNCFLGAQAKFLPSLHFWKKAADFKDLEERAEAALLLCGLKERIRTPAKEMSYGEQRQLEIAMMLAGGPALLLLDEPLAGMGVDEAKKIIALLQKLAEDHTIILIEHDMDAVFAIAQRLTVMVNGRKLKTGSLSEIRADKEVKEAYLGEDE